MNTVLRQEKTVQACQMCMVVSAFLLPFAIILFARGSGNSGLLPFYY